MVTIIGNLKPRTGKSLVTFNLAVWLTTQKKSVTVFDLDPIATLSNIFKLHHIEKHNPQLTLQQDLVNLTKNTTTEILIDIGSNDMDIIKTAVAVADRVVIPITPSQLNIGSCTQFLKLIRHNNSIRNLPHIVGFINRAYNHSNSREDDEPLTGFKYLESITMIDKRLHQRNTYRDSFSEGIAAFEFEPNSQAALEFINLAKKLYSSVINYDEVH